MAAARGSAAHAADRSDDGDSGNEDDSDDELGQDEHGSEQDAAECVRVCPEGASGAHAHARDTACAPAVLVFPRKRSAHGTESVSEEGVIELSLEKLRCEGRLDDATTHAPKCIRLSWRAGRARARHTRAGRGQRSPRAHPAAATARTHPARHSKPTRGSMLPLRVRGAEGCA